MTEHCSARKIKKDDDGKELNELAQSSLEEANTIQIDLENLSKRMMTKLLSVVQEFTLLRRPLYNKRHAALSSVPHFWAVAFMNHPKLKLLVDSSVEDCFNYLTHIQMIENDDVRSGYQVIFTFDTNPYFYNCELIKRNVYEDGRMTCARTIVDWKENMCITGERRLKGKKRGPPVENFFDWLQRSSTNRHDFICDIIKDDLWTDPLKYFFLPDDGGDDNSDSESDEDEYYDDMGDSNDEDSNDEENGDHDDKQSKSFDLLCISCANLKRAELEAEGGNNLLARFKTHQLLVPQNLQERHAWEFQESAGVHKLLIHESKEQWWCYVYITCTVY